jgi:ABC-type multidrug transport system ATPase subunit
VGVFMSEKIIEVQNITKQFGTFEAVKNVSFTVYKGDVFGFLGPNGAGKSTTLRCILSLIKPNNGKVFIFGKTLATNRNEVLSKIGCIIEKPDFYKYLSAEKNLEIFSRISGTYSDKNSIYKMLDFVGLNGREKDKVAGYSHGMKQRLGIAQALLHNPDLIILDEPTTGLDPQGIIDIRNLILQLKSEHNKTILLSSHQLSEIEIIANRMVIINKGKSIIEGNVDQLLNSEDLIVNLEIDNVELSAQIIAQSFKNVQVLSVFSNQLQLAINKSEVPELTKKLVDSQVRIFAIESKRKLEDYFIKIVNN